MKLNDQFLTVRGHILMMQPLPSVSQAFRLIFQEENHKEFSNSGQSDAMAFSTSKKAYVSGSNMNNSFTTGQFSKTTGNNATYNKKNLDQIITVLIARCLVIALTGVLRSMGI